MTYNFEAKPNCIAVGKAVSIHYVGTFDSGVEFDNSRKRGEPIVFTVGSGQMIPGFEEEVSGLTSGEKKTFTLTPERAYGEFRDNLFQSFPRSEFPDDFEVSVGTVINVPLSEGQIIPATIHEVSDADVTLNFNHPMAGQNLNFEIEVVSINSATTSEAKIG
mgnify:CR=1 FL=1